VEDYPVFLSFPCPPEGEIDPRKQRPRTAASGDERGGSRYGTPPIYTRMRIARRPWGVLSIFREVLKAYRLVTQYTETAR